MSEFWAKDLGCPAPNASLVAHGMPARPGASESIKQEKMSEQRGRRWI